ncbi:MAG: hypothetical protein ACPGD8_01785 [Flavobacteriales bacterium]
MKNVFPFFLILFPVTLFGQQKVEYTSDFLFEDGVYLTFQDFKNNNPVPITHILSELDIRNQNYLELVLDADSVTYFDNLLEERTISILRIWGFSKGGKPYIGYNTVSGSVTWENRAWFPLLSVGAYSYFTAVTIVSRFIEPSPGAMMPSRGTALNDGAMYRNQGGYYDETVPVQMLLDFSNGELVQLAAGDLNAVSPKTILEAIKSDSELHKEYELKTRKDQKRLSMFYIRLFNERNPIYLQTW